MAHGPRRFVPACALALAAFGSGACGALATSPGWVGGGLETAAPARRAEEDVRMQREREIAAKQPKEVGARHILIMHVRSKSKPESLTRTREQAMVRAEECLRKIRGGTPFEDMVKEYSDEPGAAERNGDLGVFDRTQMVKAFSDAAFMLKVGEVSEIVETPFGFHIIKRTE
jgi:peptidyl-prolyl cis-trans isomerase NIMA-interacting 1